MRTAGMPADSSAAAYSLQTNTDQQHAFNAPGCMTSNCLQQVMGSCHLVMIHSHAHAAHNISCLHWLAVPASVAILQGKQLVQCVMWVVHCQPLQQLQQGCLQAINLSM